MILQLTDPDDSTLVEWSWETSAVKYREYYPYHVLLHLEQVPGWQVLVGNPQNAGPIAPPPTYLAHFELSRRCNRNVLEQDLCVTELPSHRSLIDCQRAMELQYLVDFTGTSDYINSLFETLDAGIYEYLIFTKK